MFKTTFPLFAAIGMIALSACGGGGGGGPGGGGNGGGFTLSTQTASFTGKIQTSGPPVQQIQIHLTQTGTASITAGYRAGVTPATWLGAGISGSGSDYVLGLSITPAGLAMALGTYTTTFTVTTNDSAGNTLQARDIAVTFTLRDGLRISSNVSALATAGTPPAVQTTQFTVLGPAGITWTATSNVAWMTPPSGAHTGPGTFDVTLNNTGLRADAHSGTVTLTNTQDPTDTAVLSVLFVVQAPAIAIGHAVPGNFGAVVLGGAAGFESNVVPLRLTLGTGTNAFPWTASLTTSSGGSWLSANVTSGTVSEAGVIIELSADRGQTPRGEYHGQVHVTANVNGTFLQAVHPVDFRIEDNRLVVGANGVALSNFPGRNVLERTVRVYDSWDSTATQWQASDDQPWLTVTPSGNAGGDLVLRADPAGLADGQYTATVTITSNTARVVNQESIRVGFTSSDDDKVFVAASPPAGQFDLLDAADLTFSGALPGAGGSSNAETSWNGLLAAGASVISGDDLWVYDSAGAERARLDSGSGSLYNDTVKFSGDGTRIVSGSTAGLRIQNAPAP